MVSNLVSNSMKFTPAGGEVRVSLRQDADGVELVIQDTGCGIATDHLPHIFDRFYRVPGRDASGPERGLGLGLIVVASNAKAHERTGLVDSTPSTRIQFFWFLPSSARAEPAPSY